MRSRSSPAASRRWAITRRIVSFVARSVSGACAAICVAKASTARSIASAGSSLVTRPRASASVPSMNRPVKSISLARAGPRRSTSRLQVAPDRQLPSVRAIGMPSVDSGVAIRRSHTRAIAQPPPAATPCTWAIVAFVTLSSRSRIPSIRRSYSSPPSSPRTCWNCAMSVPATNAFPPAPRRSSTRTSGSASARSHASTSAEYMSQVIAFRASGRLNVSVAIGPLTAYSACPVDNQASLRAIFGFGVPGSGFFVPSPEP